MRYVDELKAMHLRELYRGMGWYSGIAVRDAYLRLSPEQRSRIGEYSRQLQEYLDQFGDGPLDPELLEMACLMPGAVRGKPLFMADQSPQSRPMYDSELREAREWLLKSDKMASTLRGLTPEQWRLLLPQADDDLSHVERSGSTSDIVLAMLDGVVSPDANAELTNVDEAMCAAYAQLSDEDGRELAQFALELSGVQLPDADDVAENMLAYIACFVPDALHGLHNELARREIFSFVGTLYKGAGPETSKLLLQMLDDSQMTEKHLNVILVALAWIGDETVRSAFREWESQPAPWREQLHVPPAAYAHEAGWELTDSGERRSLVSEVCYPLVPSEEHQRPVRTMAQGESKCGNCGQVLVTLLDLDLTDPRLDFLGIPGERLRVSTCDRCSLYSKAYLTEIDLNGRTEWSNLNEGLIVEPEDAWPFYSEATQKLVLGNAPKGQLQAIVCWEGGSQLGGYPGWVQGADYPACPKCGQTMRFIGQLVTDDFMGEPSEGTTFCLVCPQYHTAATVYQQT